MKELQLGKISTKELADWFGMSYGSFRNNKTKKMEELSSFCKYKEVYGGIEVIEIMDPVYVKEADKKKELIKNVFIGEWQGSNQNNLNTCANVAKSIDKKYGKELKLKESTIETYARDVRTDLFGVPSFSDGTLGSCQYLWAKAIPVDDNTYICEKLTEAEVELKNKLLKKYFTVKNADDIEKKFIIKEMVNTGEITKDMAYDLTCDLDGLNEVGFRRFLAELRSSLGCPIIKTTEILIGQFLQAEKAQLQLNEGEFDFE